MANFNSDLLQLSRLQSTVPVQIIYCFHPQTLRTIANQQSIHGNPLMTFAISSSIGSAFGKASDGMSTC